MFIPGYAITLVLYPQKKEISYVKRIGFSLVLSIISVILLVLFIDEVLAINTTSINIVAAILLFSFLALCIWKGELFYCENISKLNFNNKTGMIFFPFTILKRRINSVTENKDSFEKNTQKEEKDDEI